MSIIAPVPVIESARGLSYTIDTYDAVAETYAARFDWVDLREHRSRFMGVLQPGLVLDAGCGTGRDCRLFGQDGISTIGVDISSGMLDAASHRTSAPLIAGDVRRLPFRSAAFGGVWCCAVLLHLDIGGFARALAEFRRVLIDQGVLFISVREGVGEEIERFGTSGGLRRFVLYKSDDVADLVSMSGFDVSTAATEPGQVGRTWVNVHARCR